jgi:hypothetical protein
VQKLHLVGFTTDHKSLILSARRGARSGGFVLEVDDDVAEAVAAALEVAGEVEVVEEAALEELAPPRPQSALSVRELQARLRLGHTVESVAAEAGVDVEWVARFAAPVLAEQMRVIDATRNATFHRSRLGPSALRLGASVYRNLAAKGLTTPTDELDRGWATRQIAEGRWLVTFSYVSRGRKQQATWELDLRSGEVRATDRLGADLAFVPGAPKPATPTAAPTKPVKVPASAPTDVDRANAKRVAVARKTAEAQLADAVRRGTKQSVEVVKRAASPKAASNRAARAAKAAEELDAPVVEPVVAPAPAAPVEAPAPPPEVALVTVADVAPEPEPIIEPEPALELPLVPAPRAPGTDLDPAASAVAMVREAAEALLSDFAAGRLVDDRALRGWDDIAAEHPADEPEPEPEEIEPDLVTEPAPAAVPVAPLPTDGDDDEVVRAATPVPSRRRRAPVVPLPVVPAAEGAPVEAAAPPPAPRPSRALTRALAPPAEPVEPADAAAGRRRRPRRSDERVVRTPIDLEELSTQAPAPPPTSVPAPPAAARPVRPGPRFRDDLVTPATNGTAAPTPHAEEPAAGPTPPRRRRSEPLRAR